MYTSEEVKRRKRSEPSVNLFSMRSSAQLLLGIYLYEDEECTITFCGVGLRAGLTGYCRKHVAVLVHWRCLEINDSSAESHGEDAFYGTQQAQSVCACVWSHFCWAVCECVSECSIVHAESVFVLQHACAHPQRSSSISIILCPQNINLRRPTWLLLLRGGQSCSTETRWKWR